MRDLIDRQDAIEAICGEVYGLSDMSIEDAYEIAKEAVEDVPSAEPEIIRCKDCKWWDKSEDSPFGYCMAMKHGYMTANWEIGIYRRYKGDFYCADAERREDE